MRKRRCVVLSNEVLMKVVKGGVTAPKGFLAGAVSCGIKKSGRNDLALLYSMTPCVCAATFTTNRFRSGSVILTEGRVKKPLAQAVVVNSGNANCCAGKKEVKDAEKITGLVARKMGMDKDLVLVASTGIIGKSLPVGKIKRRLTLLIEDLKKKNAVKFSKAIMTTDTVHKEVALRVNLGGKTVTIGATAKGAGMICPNMATMLAFFTTDAAIKKDVLRTAFRQCVADSFNRITVDGDMSTNDTAIILANGLAGNRPVKKGRRDYLKFLAALRFAAKELARKIVLDGEGASKFVEVLVKGAKDRECAEKVARCVADSSLVKTMIAGGDPNWGRVAASVGSSGVKLDKNKVNLYFGKKLVMRHGAAAKVSKGALLDIFKRKDIKIVVDLKSGRNSSFIWTCDLTKDYVKINAEYET